MQRVRCFFFASLLLLVMAGCGRGSDGVTVTVTPFALPESPTPGITTSLTQEAMAPTIPQPTVVSDTMSTATPMNLATLTPTPSTNTATQKLPIDVAGFPPGHPQASSWTGGAWQVDISDNGRYLVHAYGWPDPVQIVLHDLEEGVTTLITAAPDGTPGDGLSANPAISADGSTVVFTSTSSNLVEHPYIDCPNTEQPVKSCFSLYVYQVANDKLERLFAGTEAVLSADGRYLAFSGTEGNLSGSFIYDRFQDHLTPISQAKGVVDMSAEGNVIVFVSAQNELVPGDTNHATDVFVLDRLTGQLERISTPIGGVEQGGQSGRFLAAPSGILISGGKVAVSANGRYVVFGSTAPNLVEDDLPPCSGHILNVMEEYDGPCPQYYLYDREAGRMELVSLTNDGQPANGNSFGNGAVSADGRFVVFTSTAENLWTERPPSCTSFIRHPCVQIFVRDREQGRTYLVGQGWGSRASIHAGGTITADGRFVASWLEADVLSSQQNEQWDVLITNLPALIDGQ